MAYHTAGGGCRSRACQVRSWGFEEAAPIPHTCGSGVGGRGRWPVGCWLLAASPSTCLWRHIPSGCININAQCLMRIAAGRRRLAHGPRGLRGAGSWKRLARGLGVLAGARAASCGALASRVVRQVPRSVVVGCGLVRARSFAVGGTDEHRFAESKRHFASPLGPGGDETAWRWRLAAGSGMPGKAGRRGMWVHRASEPPGSAPYKNFQIDHNLDFDTRVYRFGSMEVAVSLR
jgi:hypothetical protein